MNYLHEELNLLVLKDSTIFDFLQNSALDGLCYWNLVNKENDWINDRFWETLGYDSVKMLSKPLGWQDLIFPEDLKLMLEQLEIHKNNPSAPSYDMIVRYTHLNKHTVWIRARSIIIRDDKGEPIRMLGAHTDITKQKETELKLQRKLTKYNQIIEGANLAAWQWNIVTGELILNDNWAKLLGYDLKETLEQDISNWANNSGEDVIFWGGNIHPDDTKKVQEQFLKHFSNEIDSFDSEMRLKGKNKEWVWTLCKGKIISFTKDGLPEIMTGYHQDITARKVDEHKLNRYKELLEKTNEVARIGTWDVDLIKQEVSWSDVTGEIHEVPAGFIPNLEMGIKFYKEGENRERISRVFNAAIINQQPFDEELQIISAKNNEKWVRSIGIPVIRKGEVVRVYGVVHDITALKDAQFDTERLLNEKKDKNERLINFSYIVSHNLRSHSSNLSMLVDLINQNHPEITDNEYFKMLRTSTKSLTETVGHLNEVATMNALTKEEMVRIDLVPFIKKGVANIDFSLVECGGKVTLDLGDDVKAKVIPAYIDSIILNLLTNAVKYRALERTLLIEITTRIESGFSVISFRDNGLGINLKKHGHKLFGMYKVFHTNADARGIGLFITKNQVDAMSGKITVESEMDKGSVFSVYLRR